MVKTIKKAKAIQKRREQAGKFGIAAAVRRFMRREKVGILEVMK